MSLRRGGTNKGGYTVSTEPETHSLTKKLLAEALGSPNLTTGAFAANGYGEGSPGGFSLSSVAVIGVTSKRDAAGFASLAIGPTLTLTHLIAIPVSDTSVNPARSITSAIFGGGLALGQLWAYLLFPVLGAQIAGFDARPLPGDNQA